MKSDAHIHSMFFAPMLDHAHETMGAEDVARVLADAGTSEAELRDPRAWFSSELTDRIADAFVEVSGNPEFHREVGRRFMSPRYTGSLMPIIRLFGTPRALYTAFPNTAPRWCKSGRYVVSEVESNRVRLSFESELEKSKQVCIGRTSQIRWSFPYFFGYAPARIEHPECLHRGDARCTYDIEWTEPPPSPLRWAAPLVGALVAVAWSFAFSVGLGTGLVTTLGGLALGALLATVLRLDGQLQERSHALLEQALELQRGLEAEEQRYAQLLEAKRDVEQRVEDRTADLSRATDQLQDALAEVRALDEVKTRFFANVNHELRTPLQLILAPLDDLVAGREPAGGREPALRAMQRNATRLYALINQTLDLARVDAGAESLRRASVDPEAILQGLADSFSTAASGSGIGLALVFEGTHEPVALDAHWIESALTNLVANALRHCDPGDHVTVRGMATSDRLRFSVEDTGPGIPPEDLPGIFERFAQSRQKESGPRGTGLGLAIVHEAARLHDGVATVHSELGHGTTFVLDLPRILAASELPSDPAVSAVPAPDPRPFEEPDDTELPGVYELPGPHEGAPLAVVAEDQPDLRRYIATVLAGEYRVVACRDGRLAFDEARRRLPALVVTDRSMPEMTGVELCESLRELPETASVPVILLTAHQALADVLSAYASGADDYVTKPFHAQELLARARTHVRLRELRDQLLLQERMASVGLMAAEIAHHVRNPLNVISNGLSMIAHDVPDSRRRLVDAMTDCVTRIGLVSDDLLHLSEDRERAPAEAHHPGHALGVAVRLVEATAPDRSFATEIDESAVVHAVSGELSQVFLYVLEFASRSAGDAGRVRVTGAACEDHYVVGVAHSGSPLAEEDREGVFEPMRTDRTAARLDLSIAAHLVRAQAGTIRVVVDEALGGDRIEIGLPLVLDGPIQEPVPA
ncbi:MAG: ATP-binding protein [Myxococcota bacterium]